MNDFLTALGLVMILEGMPYFISPEQAREWILKIAALPESFLRRTGFVLMMVGLLIIYSVRG